MQGLLEGGGPSAESGQCCLSLNVRLCVTTEQAARSCSRLPKEIACSAGVSSTGGVGTECTKQASCRLTLSGGRRTEQASCRLVLGGGGSTKEGIRRGWSSSLLLCLWLSKEATSARLCLIRLLRLVLAKATKEGSTCRLLSLLLLLLVLAKCASEQAGTLSRLLLTRLA